MLAVSVLGPLVVRLDGDDVGMRRGKASEVLIRLALEPGNPIRAERLIEDLWGEDAFATQKNTLQATVSRLRRDLGDATLLTGDRSGYTLHVDPGQVDAFAALRMADAATLHVEAGDMPAALEAATEALAMFRGEILCDAGDGEWLHPHRTRLQEAHLQLVEDQLVARMGLGAAGGVIGELEELVALHPFRESLWGLLITALYRVDRQADALAAYRRVRTQLGEELGLDPGPELQALEHQVLLHDRALQAMPRSRVAASLRGNLPAASSSLVGRESDIDAVVQLLGDHRLVTVVGTAGVGKTRLAIEAAGRPGIVDTPWLVRLEPAASAPSLVETVGSALGVHDPTEATIIERLRAQPLLLVLDNCEHVIDHVARLAADVLDAVPQLRILATSQVPLGAAAEHVHTLEPLPITESIQLFAQRAGERRASFVLDEDTETTVEGLCRSLDGLPLAIELAAARAGVLSVPEIARRLDQRFALLNDPTSELPERQRALRAAIVWSHDLLFPDDQRGLWALGCFAGGASLEALESVLLVLGVPAESVLDVVTRLADRSLVVVDVAERDQTRYRLLDSVRAFALERLVEADLADAAHRAHATWFSAAAVIAGDDLRGPHQATHLDFARTERANINKALSWSVDHDASLGIGIANGFAWAWLVQGDGVVGANRLRPLLGDAQAVDAHAVATAWSFMGWLEVGGNIEDARADAERAVEIADTTGDEGLAAICRFSVAFVRAQLGPATVALDVHEEWRRSHPDLLATWEAGISWILTAHAALFSGDTARADAACAEAQQVIDPLGDQWATTQLDAVRGFLAQALHDFEDAILHFTNAAEVSHHLGFALEGFHLANLGRVLQQAGDDLAAIDVLERAIEIGQTSGEMRVASLARVRLGRVLRGMDQRDNARATLEIADEWYRASGAGGRALASRDGAALAACLLAAMDAEDGKRDAPKRLTRLVDAARSAGDAEIEVLALDALARSRAQAGDLADTGRLLEAADQRMPSAEQWLSEADRVDAGAVRELIRER